jgi:hypothetical protein
MEQIARSATQEAWGHLHPCRYVLHDRDTKTCAAFRSTLADGGVKAIRLPAEKSESERFRGTLGALCQARMPFKVDPARATVHCRGRWPNSARLA